MALKKVIAASGVILCGFVAKADAPATATWSGEAGDGGRWSTGLNWQGGQSPAAGDTVRFDLSGGGTTAFDLSSPFFVQSLLIGSGAGTFSFTGTDPLSISSAITNESAAAQAFAVPVRIGGAGTTSATVSVTNPAGELTVDDPRMGVPELVKTGAGRLTVADRAVADSKTVRIAAGTLRIATPRTGAGVPVKLLTGTEVCLWRNVKLSEVWGVAARATGAGWSCPIQAYNYSYDAGSDSATVEFQGTDGGYTKCACVTLRQVGDDVWAAFTKRGWQSGNHVSKPVANFQYSDDNDAKTYNPGWIRATCHKSIYLTGEYQTVWKNVRLADVTGCACLMGGNALNQYGWNPGESYLWEYDAQTETASCQMQIVDTGYLKSVVVELVQDGDNVRARAKDAYWAQGLSKGEDLTVRGTKSVVATSMTESGYCVYALRPTSDPVDGRIVIEDGAALDVNQLQNGLKLEETEETHGKVISVCGSGPDGRGALYNSVSEGFGSTFGHLVLTGDALAGGGCMDVRPLADSAVAANAGEARIEGPYTLTASCSRFCIADVTLALDRLVVTNGHFILASAVSGAVTNGIHLADGASVFLSTVTTGGDIPFVVDAGAQISAETVVSASLSSTLGGDLTIETGALFALANGQTLNCNGTLTIDGELAMSDSAKLLQLNGTLAGGGALTGPSVCFAGNASCWEMAVNDEGWTRKVDVSGVADTDFLVGLKRIAVTFTGALGGIFEIAPSGSLAPEQVAAVVLDVKDAQDAPVAGCRLLLEDGKLMLKIGDDTIPRHAYWTNALGDGDIFNLGNWDCTNDFNRAITSLPTADSTIHLPDGCVFNCTNGAPLLLKELIMPSRIGGDCDWSGIEAKMVGTVDLKGHRLTLSHLSGDCTITDTSTGAPGELHVGVADGQKVENKDVALAGNLLLVKEGTGTFKASKAGQSYTGGTDIAAGTFVLGTNQHPMGTGDGTCGVTVRKGATIDVNYCYSATSAMYNYTDLAGTICISGTKKNDSWTAANCWHNVISLADDATIDGGWFYLGHNTQERTLALNGHTLTLRLPTGMAYAQNLKATGGSIAVTEGEIQISSGTDFSSASVAFSGNAIVFLANDFTVADFSYAVAKWGTHENPTQVYVNGVYAAGANRPPVTLNNGATLDLSALSGEWSAAGKAAARSQNDNYIMETGLVSFANGATIYVTLGDRKERSNTKVIAWPDGEAPDAKFRTPSGSRYSVLKQNDGVYVMSGFSITVR